MKEIWKAAVGYEGAYEVSNLGRVRSFVRCAAGRLLRPGVASNGYPTVALAGHRTRTVHSLVLEAFVGPRPAGMLAWHLNGRRCDARLVNLCYGTAKENAADADRHGTRLRGTKYRSAKLTDEGARKIRSLKGHVSQSLLAKKFGVSPAAVQAVHDGRTWKHV